MAEELVVGGRFDPEGIETGANRGADAIERFANRTKESLTKPVLSAEQVAKAMTALGIAARALASGTGIAVDAQQLEQARKIVTGLNGDLIVMQELTKEERQAMEQLGSAMTRDLSRARREQEMLGAAMARDTERQLAAAERISAAANAGAGGIGRLTTNALGFNAVTSRLANGAIAASFGIATLARSSENSEGAIQSILRAVSVAALALGPTGILVGATLAAGDAIFNILDRERREMEKTEKQFLDSLNRMRDAADLGGLARLQQQLFSGRTTIDAAGNLVKTEGIQQLRTALTAIEDQIRRINSQKLAAPGTAGFDIAENEARNRRLAVLEEQRTGIVAKLAPLEQQYTAAVAATTEAIGASVDRNTVALRLDADRRREAEGAAAARRAEAEAARLIASFRIPSGLQFTLPDRPDRPTVGPTPMVTVDPLIPQTPSILRRAATEASFVAGHFEHALTDAQQIVQAFGTLPGIMGTFSTGLASAVQLTRGIQAATAQGAGTVDVLAGLSSAIGGAVGIVGAVGTLASAMFGQTEEERLTRQALDNNRRALDALTIRFDAGAGTAGRALNVGAVAAEIAASGLFGGPNVGPARTADAAALLRMLADAGLSFTQVQAQAEALGLSLVDSNGALIANAELYRQLADALAIANAHLFTFSDSLSDQRRRLETRDQLFGKTSPADEIARELTLFAENAAGSIASTFANFDPNTAAGRDAIRQGLQDLFSRMEAGTLRPEDLPGFSSMDEFLAFLTTVNGDLNDLSDATRNATSAMLNVPTGFKVALATFTAQDPTTVGGGGGSIPVEGPTTRDPWNRHTTTAGMQTIFHFHFAPGAIATQAKSGDALLDEMLTAADQRARSSSGDARWLLKTMGRA